MPNLTIPDRHKEGVIKLQNLDEGVIDILRAAIKKASSLPGPDRASSIITLASEANVEEPALIAETIDALYAVKSTKDVSVEEFVRDVCDAIGTKINRDKLTKNLLALLSVDEAELAAKALDLQTEDERTFCPDSRILTDLRPVFGVNVSEGPKAMVIVHILKLGYHRTGSGRHRNVYVSLDAEDLKTLRSMIDRAEEKAKSLRNTVVNVDYLARS
jgi:hypothetical protein